MAQEELSSRLSSAEGTSTSGQTDSADLHHTEALRLQTRSLQPPQELSYLYCQDQNGVCHYLGTAGRTQEFINPMLTGRLEVRSLHVLLVRAPVCRGIAAKDSILAQHWGIISSSA